MTCWDTFYLEGLFWIQLCRASPKRLYVLLEKHQRRLLMKKWGGGGGIKISIKGYASVPKVQFVKKLGEQKNQCTSILPQADRPEMPCEVNFWPESFEKNVWMSGTVTFWDGDVERFQKGFLQFVSILAWNRARMMRGNQLSFWRQQINWSQTNHLVLQGIATNRILGNIM